MNLWKLTAIASLVVSTGAMAGYGSGPNEESLIYQSGVGNQAYVQQGAGGGVFATGSTTAIYQNTNASNNYARTDQTAQRSLLRVEQKNGSGNTVGYGGAGAFTQKGADNQALIVQNGSNNNVVAPSSNVQNGNFNYLSIAQTGNGNSATPTQNNGAFNTTLVTQTGNNNQATTSQDGSFNTTTVTQSPTALGSGFGASGNSNVATTSQTGAFNNISLNQSGSSKGNGNMNGHTTVSQLGIANNAVTTQDDWGGETDISQTGGGNNALVVQNSPSDPVAGFSTAEIEQQGAWNQAAIIQNYGVVNGPVSAAAEIHQTGNSFANVALIVQN